MVSVALIGATLLSACSSFNLGAMLYCPHGQFCNLIVDVPNDGTDRREPEKK